MVNILLNAHGRWDPKSKPPYTIVPTGSKLLFFTENLKLYMDSDLARDQLMRTEPSQIVDGGNRVQNFTVKPNDNKFITPAGMDLKEPSDEVLLCTNDICQTRGRHAPPECEGLFADAAYQNGIIYFGACREVKLKAVGSDNYYRETGVNQNQIDRGRTRNEPRAITETDKTAGLNLARAGFEAMAAGNDQAFADVEAQTEASSDVVRAYVDLVAKSLAYDMTRKQYLAEKNPNKAYADASQAARTATKGPRSVKAAAGKAAGEDAVRKIEADAQDYARKEVGGADKILDPGDMA